MKSDTVEQSLIERMGAALEPQGLPARLRSIEAAFDAFVESFREILKEERGPQ